MGDGQWRSDPYGEPVTHFLVDKSALLRLGIEAVHRRLAPIIEAGEAAACFTEDIEVFYSLRTLEVGCSERLGHSLAHARVTLNEAVFERALDIRHELAKSGSDRLPVRDLLVAAAAELGGLTVLHYDSDYDLIAAVTGQATEWVVPQGSVS